VLEIPVVRALVCAHEAGIVHRDLKPENIMLADSGAVKVLDFGIAKLLSDTEAPAPGIGIDPELDPAPDPAPDPGHPARIARTRPGAMMGTLAYMSPEQWGAGTIDARTDVWAMGILLFEMVVGEHPLAPISLNALASVPALEQPMPSVRERLPAIGKLGATIDRCLIKDKASRLGSARELLGELEAVARPALAGAADALKEANPYAGLSAFQERDAARFFGRERAVEQIVARLSEQPLLALVGSSGAGKSSLVRAGVIPALKRGGDAWEAFVLRPGPHPLAALAELLLQSSWQGTTRGTGGGADSPPPLEDREALVERLRREPGLLGVQMRARARRRMERILLFVDQLEELVTLTAEDERAAFLACLIGAADDASSPVRIVLSVRQDFLDRIAGTQAELADLLSRGTVLVGPMGPSELRDALIKPAERQQLTEASYRAFGGVSGALASHADSVLAGLSHAERRWTRLLLLRLITPERTRAIVTRGDLADLAGATSAELSRVLGRLIDARLVTVEGAGRDESTVELVHESLIETWRALVGWLEEEQGDAHFRGWWSPTRPGSKAQRGAPTAATSCRRRQMESCRYRMSMARASQSSWASTGIESTWHPSARMVSGVEPRRQAHRLRVGRQDSTRLERRRDRPAAGPARSRRTGFLGVVQRRRSAHRVGVGRPHRAHLARGWHRRADRPPRAEQGKRRAGLVDPRRKARGRRGGNNARDLDQRRAPARRRGSEAVDRDPLLHAPRGPPPAARLLRRAIAKRSRPLLAPRARRSRDPHRALTPAPPQSACAPTPGAATDLLGETGVRNRCPRGRPEGRSRPLIATVLPAARAPHPAVCPPRGSTIGSPKEACVCPSGTLSASRTNAASFGDQRRGKTRRRALPPGLATTSPKL
jgi:hypothetical protein